MPKHHQVYLLLLEKLRNGAFADGLPSEHALMAQYQVARVTVRKALARLAEEGLIERRPRLGTRPTANSMSLADMKLAGLLGNLLQANLNLKVQVLLYKQVPASNVVRAALNLAEEVGVLKSVRLRSNAVGPVSHVTTFTPLEFARAIKPDRAEPLLVQLRESGVEVGRAKQRISAHLADAPVAPLLGIEVGSALLAVSRIFFNKQEQPVQFDIGLYRPDRYQYEMELSDHGDLKTKVWICQAFS